MGECEWESLCIRSSFMCNRPKWSAVILMRCAYPALEATRSALCTVELGDMHKEHSKVCTHSISFLLLLAYP